MLWHLITYGILIAVYLQKKIGKISESTLHCALLCLLDNGDVIHELQNEIQQKIPVDIK